METLIVVPARYGSSRFLGKPLALINGISMVRRTARAAQNAAEHIQDCAYVVATDNADIAAHCQAYDIPAIMTPPHLATGSDRAYEAATLFDPAAKFILNLQGDAPFTPIEHIVDTARAVQSGADVATPYVQLSWEALDLLREHKKVAPFSGTCVIIGKDNKAIWFSKNIVPAIRKEEALRLAGTLSPICRHIGLYAYKADALKRFITWPESAFEKLEGLEQLRLIENGLSIHCVRVEPPNIAAPGIDTPQDVALAEDLIATHGDPFS